MGPTKTESNERRPLSSVFLFCQNAKLWRVVVFEMVQSLVSRWLQLFLTPDPIASVINATQGDTEQTTNNQTNIQLRIWDKPSENRDYGLETWVMDQIKSNQTHSCNIHFFLKTSMWSLPSTRSHQFLLSFLCLQNLNVTRQYGDLNFGQQKERKTWIWKGQQS